MGFKKVNIKTVFLKGGFINFERAFVMLIKRFFIEFDDPLVKKYKKQGFTYFLFQEKRKFTYFYYLQHYNLMYFSE